MDISPDSKIGRGLWGAPKALVLALGIASILIAIGMVVLVVRSRLKKKRGDDLSPISSRGRSGPPSSRPAPRARP